MDCSDCKPDRREFLKAAAMGSLALAANSAPKIPTAIGIAGDDLLQVTHR